MPLSETVVLALTERPRKGFVIIESSTQKTGESSMIGTVPGVIRNAGQIVKRVRIDGTGQDTSKGWTPSEEGKVWGFFKLGLEGSVLHRLTWCRDGATYTSKENFRMDHVEKCIEVEAPLTMVYNQWTQFEEFPRFMQGVEEVKQLDEKRLRWRAEIGGKVVEWDAEIFEQIPDRRVAWRSTSGPLNSGMVNFESLGANRTKVWLKMNYKPEGTMEKIGSAIGVVSQRVEGDLERFKEFIEARGAETGAWRGQIEGRHVESDRGSMQPGDALPRSQRQHGISDVPTPMRGNSIPGPTQKS